MFKWILTSVIAIFLLGISAPHLARILGLGSLPGDVVCRFRGRTYVFPFTSTLLLSILAYLLLRFL